MTLSQKIGGQGKIVVIDETALGKRKYHRGKNVASETTWILSTYDVEENKGITENVEEGTPILTDELRVCACLGTKGFIHKTVNHSQEFMTEEGVHMNHIYAYLSRMKAFLRKRHITRTRCRPSELDSHMTHHAERTCSCGEGTAGNSGSKRFWSQCEGYGEIVHFYFASQTLTQIFSKILPVSCVGLIGL